MGGPLIQDGCCYVAEEGRTVCVTRAEGCHLKSCLRGITRGIHNVLSTCGRFFKAPQLSSAVVLLCMVLQYAPLFVALSENLNFCLAFIGS